MQTAPRFLPGLRPRTLGLHLLALLAATWFSVSGPALAITFEPVTGTISGDYESMTLDIEVGALEKHYLSEIESEWPRHIGLIIGNDTSEILGGLTSTYQSGYNNNYYWEWVSGRPEQDGNQWKFYAQVIVRRNSDYMDARPLSEAKQTDNGKEVIMVKPIFRRYEAGAFNKEDRPEKPYPVERTFAVPNEAPSGFALTTGHKSIYVSWQGGSSVAYNVDSVHRTPSSVSVWVFASDSGPVGMRATELLKTETGESAEETCTYQSAGEGEPCITCKESANPISLIDEKPSHEGAIAFKTAANNSQQGMMTISGLDVDKEYTVVMQYGTGAKRTACLKASPIETATLTELNGGAEASLGDVRCFIVTAAYGSPFPEAVKLFRWFREAFLMPTSWGRAFVDAYYRYSPPFADTIRTTPALKLAVQALLLPPSLGLYAFKLAYEAPFAAALALLVLVLAAVGIQRQRRRLRAS